VRRLVATLGVLVLSTVPAAGSVAARPGPSPSGRMLTYDDHLRAHLSYPAVQQADAFVARQEAKRKRPPPVATCTPGPAYNVGDQRKFWVSQQQLGNMQIDAVLAAKSDHGYVWVQKEFYLPLGQSAPGGGFVRKAEAEKAAADWESIYAVDRRYFGSEPNPFEDPVNLASGLPPGWRDADCDPHVHILNFPIDAPVVNGALSYVAGYFSSEHEYPNGSGEHESPFSNEAEMFFMNSLMLNVGSATYNGVLAHEFFHMIQFSNDYNEETWVNEGMADVAAVVNGFGDVVEGHIDSYEEHPDQHLFDWTSDLGDYGQAFLYFDYFFNHYGAPENPATTDLESYIPMARVLTQTPADGAEGITTTLVARSKKQTRALDAYYRTGDFEKVYADYAVANFVDDPALDAGQYGYANRDVAVAASGGEDSSPPDSTVHPYGADYYDIQGDGSMAATAEDPVAIIPASEGQPAPTGGFFAWSNRADEMLTWLQRPADLSTASSPQLTFEYWHQIEEDWDYAYVRVSRDGGATWDFLNTSACGGRATNPNGNNRAVAETGGITGDSGGWQSCTLDLAQYAGSQVLVRFEYDTDQAVTEPGYVVDDVALTDAGTAIWPTTDFEAGDRGFTFGGDGTKTWLRLRPLADNQALFQVVSIASGTVTRTVLRRSDFTAGANGLELATPVPIAGRSVMVFSGTTPIATQPFGYSYAIQR
jgi:immune inhibitor A